MDRFYDYNSLCLIYGKRNSVMSNMNQPKISPFSIIPNWISQRKNADRKSVV